MERPTYTKERPGTNPTNNSVNVFGIYYKYTDVLIFKGQETVRTPTQMVRTPT